MAGRGTRGDNALSTKAEDGDPARAEPAAAESAENGAASALTASVTLPGVETSVARGRRFVRETLGTRHPALENVALGVSELATNAIMHTPSGDGGQVTIRVVAGGSTVRAEVVNDGTAHTKPRVRRDAEAEHGRGILILEALADAWGVLESAGKTTVWAEFCAMPWAPPHGREAAGA